VVLEEKKLLYERVNVDITKGEQKKSDFLKLNPYGKVPVIVDGVTVVYESLIINEYLEDKYPDPPLMPKDPARKAKIRILIDYGMRHLAPSYQRLTGQMDRDERERDMAAVEASRRELKNLLSRFEREIGKGPYLAGDFSLLDAALAPRFIRLETLGVLPDASLPRLGEWLRRVKERPSVRAIL
jgi:glutathione S-transferase